MTFVPAVLVSIAALGAAPQNVLLDFTATWCGPCQQMSPIVSRLQRQGYPIRKIDVDRDQATAARFGISGIPAFVLVINGKEADRVVGMTSESKLKSLLSRIPRATKSTSTKTAPRKPAAKSGSKAAGAKPLAASSTGNGVPSAAPRRDRFSSASEQPPLPPMEPVIRAKFDRRENVHPVPTVTDPLASSTRIRVVDNGGTNFGSGTIIDSRTGRTIVLTCGHIFRGIGKDSKIEVDVFEGKRHETYVGKLIRHNLEADVGLVEIATETPLSISPVAVLKSRFEKGDPVVSVGCGGGDPPTKLPLRITALNKYLGPDNIECTGVPMQGRSGGGLFNRAGQVIGVCIAADPPNRRGLYAGLKAIHELLDRARLSHLYQKPTTRSPDGLHNSRHELASRGVSGENPMRSRTAAPSLLTAASKSVSHERAESENGSSNDEFDPALLKGIDEAEVVCIIRPLNKPRAASRIVIINRASSKFVSYLTHEMSSQPRPTMHSVPHVRAKQSTARTVRSPKGPQRYRRSAESRLKPHPSPTRR